MMHRSSPSTSCFSEEANRRCCNGNPLWLDYPASAKSHPLYRLCVSIAWMLGSVIRIWCRSWSFRKLDIFMCLFSFFVVVVSAGCNGSLMLHWWHALAILREAKSLLSTHRSHSVSAVLRYIRTALVSFGTQTKVTRAVSVVLLNWTREYKVERTEEEKREEEENPRSRRTRCQICWGLAGQQLMQWLFQLISCVDRSVRKHPDRDGCARVQPACVGAFLS